VQRGRKQKWCKSGGINRAIFGGLVRILRLLRALQMEIFSQCWEREDECMLVPFLKSKKEVPANAVCFVG